jgi:hypothetical protein
MFSTNVTGLINMTQAILPIFKARSTPSGDIINIGSIAGREPYQGGSIYCATKAAVRSFTDAMRKELIATRIRVIEIDPGQVETEFSVVRFGGDKEKAKKVYEGVEPLTPEDIAEVVVFAAGRRENVVLADSLIFPNHQVCAARVDGTTRRKLLTSSFRQLRPLCTENLLVSNVIFDVYIAIAHPHIRDGAGIPNSTIVVEDLFAVAHSNPRACYSLFPLPFPAMCPLRSIVSMFKSFPFWASERRKDSPALSRIWEQTQSPLPW